jgi:hypothetical protein
MKKLICSIALVTTLVAFASAQQLESSVTQVFSGEWQWTSYAGGAQNVSATDAPAHYALRMSRDPQAKTSLFYICTFVKDSIYYGSKRMQITEDPSNAAFPYKLHYDVTAPLFNGAAMPSVNFRIVENNWIEFSNGSNADFRYLFKNVGKADGC